ncbi:MAG: restriction endonuclease subunit R [Hormoscilla sp. GUM202]|nr:restriction endonuclease subunit R [Hormoscilla sp. GUM202]
MVETIQAKNLELHEVEEKFGLQLVDDDRFFREWQDDLPELTEIERQRLDRVKASYLHISKYPRLEKSVKMVVLSPLLDLAGFYLPPFRIATEKQVQIAVEDRETIIKGELDVLVLHNNFWVLVIESKRHSLSLEPGIPQVLAYMLANRNGERPMFGMVTNGGNFIFLKVTEQGTPQYANSDEFVMRRRDDLYTVLKILKHIGQLAIG